MKLLRLLTSRGFAVFLLIVSTVFLIFWKIYPDLYSPAFIIIPAFLFASILFCAVNRIAKHGRRPVRFWGSILFHAGMLVIIAAVSYSAFKSYFSATLFIPKGDWVNLDDKDLSNVFKSPLNTSSPFIDIKLNEFDVAYEDERFPVKYTAGVDIKILKDAGYSTITDTIGINSPIHVNGYTFLMESGGYVPRFVLKDKSGSIIFDRYIRLLNKTKDEDAFVIPQAGLKLFTRFFPDMFRDGAKTGSRSSVVRNPAFGIKIVKATDDPFKDVWKGVLKPGENAAFEDLLLEFADLRPYVVIQVVNDPMYWGIVAGWIMIFAGLVIRYLPAGAKEKQHAID